MVVIWVAFGFVCLILAQNKGLNKTAWFIWGVLCGPFALVVLIFKDHSKNFADSKDFKASLEQARRAEFKEQWEKAIDHYGDAMYYMGKAKPKGKVEKEWVSKTMNNYKRKVEELKDKLKEE